jgi:hypothetical protein
MQKILRLAAVMSLALGTAVLGASTAQASAGTTCTGTLESPGVLVGTYNGNVTVTGLCVVDSGAAVINGNLVIRADGAVGAAFALNHATGTGTSSLTVRGNVTVGSGAVLSLGCEPAGEPCSDAPDATTAHRVLGNVSASSPLGVVFYADRIGGNVQVSGGGGGVSCDPPFPGIFASVDSPAFSDAEDNVIGGNLTFTGLRSCWLGAIRNSVGGNVTMTGNTLADPTADMIVSNHVGGNLTCTGNSPAAQFAVGGSANQVRGNAAGECGFGVKKPNPAPDGPLQPISVRGR